MPHAPLQTFIIYARADEAHKNELLRHLKGTLIASGALRVWQDGNLLPGEEWEKSIKHHLTKSDLVLVLVSSDALSSDFINTEELRLALEQRAAGRTTVVPIILRSCLWGAHPVLRGLQGLPKNMKPVKSYHDADEAWTEVLEGLERILAELVGKNAPSKAAQPATPAPADPADEVAWKMALRLDVEAAYRHYLDDFPNGNHAAEAARRTAALTAKVITPKLELPAPKPLLRDCPDCPEMVFVKGGTFMMGSEEGEEDEQPVHPVSLSDFYIGKYPVTFAEYDRFCEATKRPKPDDNGWGRGTRPVINVSWDNADDYCDWLSEKTGQPYRLPTEAEWEFAARGGVKSKGRKYSGSNHLDEVGWYWENSGDKRLSGEWSSEKIGKNNCRTHPVGEKASNELGLHDLSGNVWEWCRDWYDEKCYASCQLKGTVEDPTGPDTGEYAVLRGGSWVFYDDDCRVARRFRALPNQLAQLHFGFRLARTAGAGGA